MGHVRLARHPLACWLERSFLNLPFRSPKSLIYLAASPLSGSRIVTTPSSVRSLSPSLLLVDFCEVLPLLSAFAHVPFSTILHLGLACPLLDNSPLPLLDHLNRSWTTFFETAPRQADLLPRHHHARLDRVRLDSPRILTDPLELDPLQASISSYLHHSISLGPITPHDTLTTSIDRGS